MNVRPAKTEEIAAIQRLAQTSVTNYFSDFASQRQKEAQLSWLGRSETIARYLDDDALLLVAEEQGHLLGVGGVKTIDHLAWFGFSYVGQAERGVGSRIMQARIDWLLSREPRWWCLAESYLGNQRAYQHLRRHGFLTTGIERPSRPEFNGRLLLWARSLVADQDGD